jgi:hypothetical protein
MSPMETETTNYNENVSKRKESMSKQEIKKDMYAAGFLLDLACNFASYIMGEQYEGENVDDLNAALATIKAAIVDELTEPDDALDSAIAMASKVTNLKKGSKKMAEKKEVEKTEGAEETKIVKSKKEKVEVEKNVVGGVERDENGEVKEDDSPAEGESAENAVTATEITPEGDEEAGAEADEADETAKDEADGKTKVDVKADKKSTKPQGLEKSVNTLLEKLDVMNDLQKTVSELNGKVEQLSALEDRIGVLEKLPAASKVKASYHDVSKAGEEVDTEQAEVSKLQERQAELMADPQAGTPQERNEVYNALYRANQKGLLDDKETKKE